MQPKEPIQANSFSDQEVIQKLLRVWQVDELKFIGMFTRNKVGHFFNKVLANKRPLKYPDNYGNVGLFCSIGEGLEEGKYYEFYCCLAPLDLRKKKGNPYLLNVDTSKPITPIDDYELTESSNEHFIKDIFNIRGLTPDDAARTARQLRLNELELYTQTERFIFELIQNADDMPKASGVSVEFILTNDFFVFLHNGLPFMKEHVSAIADAGKSTKMADTKKTGYKGIGFKSVFSDASTVFIHSGYFSFRFDKDYYNEIQFDELYSHHIKTLNQKGLKEFYARYKGREKELTSIESIPWQIKPIWTTYREFPDELKSINDFLKKEVAIALKIGRETIQNKNYNQILKSLFGEPRFLLFLRNVRNIWISTESINLKVNIHRSGYLKTISSEDTITSETIRNDYITDKGMYQIKIDNDTFEKVGVPIIIHTENEKSIFKKKDGTSLNNIPEKLAKLDSTSISFAAKIKDGKIVKLPENDAILFNYLPTNDIRFGFPFLVNADFITTTNRETIIAENPWNIYLFYHIGYYAIRWIADTALVKISDNSKDNLRNSVLSLLPKKQNDTKEIHRLFNNGLQKGLETIPFIPCEYDRTLIKVDEAVLDKTGVFKKPLFYKNFKELFPKKDIVNYNLLYCLEKLCKEDVYGFSVIVFDKDDIYKLFELVDFAPKNNSKYNIAFIRLLKENNIVEVLKKFPSIQNQLGQLKKPEELFIYVDEDDKESVAFDTSINFLNTEIELFAIKHKNFEDILLTDLGIKRFNPVDYLKSISQQFSTINKAISDKDANIRFWRFIFKNRTLLSDNDKAKLENFTVITTEGQFVVLKNCFLSSEYRTTYQIEEVANQIGLTGLKFVSVDLVNNQKELEDYKSFLYKCGARYSEGWELYRLNVKQLITSNQITNNNCFVITKFIFDVYKNNRNKFDLSEKSVLKNLKILTENNGLQNASLCIFSNPKIYNILPDYILENQVSRNYLDIIENSYQQEWKEFLLAIGVIELSEVEIVKRKFDKIVIQSKSLDFDNSIKVWRFVYNYSDILINDNSRKQKLKEIPLPLKNGTLSKSSTNIVYFPNEFKPKSKIEELLTGHYEFFISQNLPENHVEIEKWKTFLKIVGVQEVIASTGSGNNFEIHHIEHLIKYDFSVLFWKYFQEQFSVAEINMNSKFRTRVIEMKCIPCLDKEMRKPDEVYPNTIEYRNEINDDSKISGYPFNDDMIAFLGLRTDLGQLLEDTSYLKYIGNLGEKFVYEQIKIEYSNRGTLVENELGFIIEQNQNKIIEVIWNNKPYIDKNIRSIEDSGNPFDLSITELETTNYIEVKSTIRNNNVFKMPESEWNWMLTYPKNYSIYRVNNAIQNPTISLRILAIDALLNGQIKPNSFPLSLVI